MYRDEDFMLRAVELAEGGRGRTSPNPLVGAVVVSGGEIVGEGFHRAVGKAHAEVNALDDAGALARDSTMYVTLEPCTHHGRTPPCVDRIIESGVDRVVIAMRDPNRQVSGSGKEFLEDRGVAVEVGLCEDIVRRQNEAYIKRTLTGLPFVTLKMAMSLDGKIATKNGDSGWISSEESRRDVHLMRAESDAVMVGVGTVLSDDPRLTVRINGEVERVPLRVVVDSLARTPVSCNVARVSQAPTMVAVSRCAPGDRISLLQGMGVEVFVTDGDDRVRIDTLLAGLSDRGCTSVLVEGGPRLAEGLLSEDLIDKIVLYVAPIVIGGSSAPGPFGGEGIEVLSDAVQFRFEDFVPIGRDLKVVCYPKRGD